MKMDEETHHAKGGSFAASWSLSAKPCDSCKSSSALLFCRADSAFLCITCDSKIHTANKLASRHERVWMCEVCEQAPASVTCKADAAALCVTCDRDIHSANPLARRHERFPVVPFYESAASALKSSSMNLLVPDGNGSMKQDEEEAEIEVEEEDDNHHHHHLQQQQQQQDREEEAEAASWLLTNPNPVITHKLMETPDLNCADQYFFSDVDPYLDLDYTSSMANGGNKYQHRTNDSVVPVQPEPHHTSLLHPDFEFCIRSNSKPSYSYTTPSLSQSVSSSSLEVGVVPDGNSDVSNAFMNNGMESVGMGTGAGSGQACQLTGMDREARVLRYREKRKNRKFEKTIRYASRKAYAETRPRIKGRFAKRTELEAEVDRLYSSAASLMADASGYGIVPSF